MKLSDLRPCDACGGKLKSDMAAGFYVVRFSLAMFKPQAANQVLGLTQIFQGALRLAEAMAPEADVVMVCGDEEPALMTELLVCMDCFLKPLDIALLSEKRNHEIDRAEQAKSSIKEKETRK